MEKEPQEMYTFFLDTSGSVGNSSNYWDTVRQLFNLYAARVNNFCFWNSQVEPVNKKRFQQAIQEKKGWAGTSPETVAEKIVKDKIKNIILITDGEVSQQSVAQCDKILGNYKLQNSLCYIISTSGGELNMSVTCPFTRQCRNQVYSKPKNSPLQKLVQYTPEDFQQLKKLDEITLDNFDSKYELLEGLIIALNMGKQGNIPLKNEIVIMKNRLVKELSKKMNVGNYSQTILGHLQQKNQEDALKAAKQMTHEYFNEGNSTEIEKKISHLINLCGDLRGKYSLNEIKSNKMAIAKNAVQTKIDKDVQVTDLTKTPIQCPIILDEDVPQILIDQGEPILLGVQKHIVDDIVACPLRILNYPQIKDKFKKRLSNYVGIAYGDKFMKNPFTQNKLLGAIPLGTHHSHVKVANYTIANMLTGGKILGNLNLYYAVIWYLIKNGDIEYLKDIAPNAEQQLIYRLKHSFTMASLCGLAQFVTTQLRLDVAIWYCVNSGYFNQPTDRDTFRYHVFNMQPLIAMVKVLGYPIVKGAQQHLNRTKAMLSLLSNIKKLTTNQKKDFKAAVQCLYQKAVQIDPKKIKKQLSENEVTIHFVPIDGQADKQQITKVIQLMPKNVQHLSPQELYFIASKVNPQLSASDIFLDFNLVIPPLPKFQVNWAYGLTQYPSVAVKICPKTLRPYYNIGDLTWQDVVTQIYGIPVKKMIMKHKYFEAFIIKHRRLPISPDQFTIFLYNRYIENGNHKTLPFLSKQWSEDTYNDYMEYFKGKQFNFVEVQKTLEASRPIIARAKMQTEIQQQ